MRTNRRTTALLAGLTISAGTHAASAQPPSNRDRSVPAHSEVSLPQASDSYLGVERFNLDFPGGTVSQYVDSILHVQGVVANISLTSDAGRTAMPPLKLTNVSLEVAVNAVETVVNQLGQPVLYARTIDGDNSANLYIISPTPTPPVHAPDISTQSFRVQHLFSGPGQSIGITPDDLLGAIETLLQLDTQSTPPQVVLHRETGTLIMRGSESQIDAVEELLGGLKEDVFERRDRDQGGLGRRAAMQRDLIKGEMHTQAAKARVEDATTAATELEKLVIAGAAPQKELMEQRARVREFELQYQEMLMDLEAMREELNNLTSDSEPSVTTAEPSVKASFAIPRDRADAILEGALAMCEVMSPPASVEPSKPGDSPAIIITGTQSQLRAFERWLNASASLAK